MKRAKAKWKSSELWLLAAPLLFVALWLGATRASKYLRGTKLPALRYTPGKGAPVFGHKSYTQSVVFSPDGKYLLSFGSANNREDAFGPNEVALWDVDSRSLKRLVKCPRGVTAIAFGPDGEQIAFADPRMGIRVLNGSMSRQIFNLPVGTGKVESLAFSPEGRILAATVAASKPKAADEILLWYARGGVPQRRIKGSFRSSSGLQSYRGAFTLHFSPDSKSIFTFSGSSSSDDSYLNAVAEFDVHTGRRLRVWPRRNGEAWMPTLDVSRDGKRVAAVFRAHGQYGLAMLDAASPRSRWEQAPTYPGLMPPVVAFSPDGNWLTSSSGDQIEIRNARTGALKTTFEIGTGINSFAWSPYGDTLAIAGKLIEMRDVSGLTQP